MKFGGTSVADAERIKRAARRIVRAREQGRHVVAVPTGGFYDPAHAHLGRHLVRFAFCKRDEVLAEAVQRLRRLA